MRKQFMAQMNQMMSVGSFEMAPVAFAGILVIALALALILAPIIILVLLGGVYMHMIMSAGKKTHCVG